METKETTPENRTQPAKTRPEGARKPRPAAAQTEAPKKKRPAPAGEAAPKKRPASPEETRTRSAEAPRKRPAAAEAPKKRPAQAAQGTRKKAPAKKKPEPAYKPYHKANTKKRAIRTRKLAADITRFFSCENPLLKAFSKQDSAVFGDADSRSQKKAMEEAKRRKRAAILNTPAIVYTQPRAFNRNRLIVQLLTILAVVMALVLGMSVFFKVEKVTVSGANVYSPWTVREVSGIKEGDNLLTFGRTRASGQIIANLPYVKSARIGIKLPDTVNIEIEEAAVVYAIQDEDSVWWLINSDGKVVEQTSTANARNYTKVLGVTLTLPHPGEQSLATEPIPTETNELGEFLPVTVTGASQLNAALHILQALENNDIVGSATSVDVTRLNDIILWYGSQYQVNLGTTEKIDYKISCMKDAILQMSDYQTGILDVSFITMPDKIVYTPFG